MGMCPCPLVPKRSKVEPLIAIKMEENVKPHLHFNTANDKDFLHFVDYWKMEHTLRQTYQRVQSIDLQRQNLNHFLEGLRRYQKDIETMSSNLSQRLARLESLDQFGYLILEVQEVSLKENCSTLEFELLYVMKRGQETEEKVLFYESFKQKRGSIFILNRCWSVRVPLSGFLCIRLNRNKKTSILIKDIEKVVAVAEIVNLRTDQDFESAGQLSFRAQCLSDGSSWKVKTLNMLKMRRKQIEKLLQMTPQQLSSPSGQSFAPRRESTYRDMPRRVSYYEPSLMFEV